MEGPFVIRAYSRINPGAVDDYRPLAQEICRQVEEREPRVLAFNIWVSEDEGSEVVLQVHPDAASLEHHLELLGDLVRGTFAYTEFLDLEVYGPVSERLRQLFATEGDRVRVTYHPVHWGGFTRLGS
jgi:hypothetical protein